jgi:hypothetical protein
LCVFRAATDAPHVTENKRDELLLLILKDFKNMLIHVQQTLTNITRCINIFLLYLLDNITFKVAHLRKLIKTQMIVPLYEFLKWDKQSFVIK